MTYQLQLHDSHRNMPFLKVSDMKHLIPWIYVEFCVQFFQLTQAVDAVRVWTGLILLDKLKTMWWLVDEYTTVVSAAVNDLPQTVPGLSVHLEFNGVHILHLHYLCTVW